MVDAKKWSVAFAQLNALASHLPLWPGKDDVAFFHDIISRMEAASGEDYSAFRITQSRIRQVMVSKTPSMTGGPEVCSYATRVDTGYFHAQVQGLQNLFSPDKNQSQGRRQVYPPQPPSTINIGAMTNSNFVHGSSGTDVNQSVSIRNENVRELVSILREFVANDSLTQIQKSDVDAELSTAEAQLKSSGPKPEIIRSCLRSAQTILENAVGGFIGSTAHTMLVKYLSGM